MKAPVVKKTPTSTNKRIQEIKPIIIDDEQDTPSTAETYCPTNMDAKSPIKHPPNQTYPQPAIRLPPRPPDPLEPIHRVKAGIEPNRDIEKNSPHQECIITEMYESPDKSDLEQPQELSDLVGSTKLIHKYFPKQVDIDKIIDIIKRKVLKGTHLPLTIKEIQAGYLSSSFLKDCICVFGTQ